MTEKPRVFGAEYSVYVRIVRLTLAEKGVDYDLVPIDIFAGDGPPHATLNGIPSVAFLPLNMEGSGYTRPVR